MSQAGQGRILTSNRKDRLIFLEGAQFAACLFLRVSKNIPPNRMSERHTAVVFYCLYAVLFYCIDFSVSRLFPLPSASIVQT